VITVITDGSACNKSKKGGWAAIVRNSTTLIELTGWAEDTTSNRMELTAAVEALRAIPVPSEITVVTDSAYLRNTMIRKWYERWFTEERSKPRPNLDLWEALAGLASFHTITWVKVKGHSGDYWNTRVDHLASWARTDKKEMSNEIILDDFQCSTLNTEFWRDTQFVKRCGLYANHVGKCDFRGQPAIKDIDADSIT